MRRASTRPHESNHKPIFLVTDFRSGFILVVWTGSEIRIEQSYRLFGALISIRSLRPVLPPRPHLFSAKQELFHSQRTTITTSFRRALWRSKLLFSQSLSRVFHHLSAGFFLALSVLWREWESWLKHTVGKVTDTVTKGI